MALGVNDSSASAHQFTCAGNAWVSTAQAKFGSASLDNTTTNNNGEASTPWTSDFAFGSGQFTVEAFVYYTAHSTTVFEALVAAWNSSGDSAWWLGTDSGGKLACYYSTTGSDNPTVGGAWSPSLNTWYHVAMDRDASNVLRLYANGVVIASATVSATFHANTSTGVSIGNQWPNGQQARAYFDEVRISNVARFGGAFTPPAAAYTPDANTVLLLHFDRGAQGSIAQKINAGQPAAQPGGGPGAVIAQAGRAPTPGPKTVSGIVSVNGSGTAGLLVRAYAKATGELIGQATSGSGGTYSIPCGANWSDVTVIAYDPTTYQAIAFDRVTPA